MCLRQITFSVLLTGSISVSAVTEPYQGSSFNEVRDVIFKDPPPPTSEPAKQELATYQANQLPYYAVSRSRFFDKTGKTNLLERDAKRTIEEQQDYYPRIEKRLHANGICFTGTWAISEASKYSGYFAAGKKALFIARASVAMTEPERGSKRGFGFAGKIFPTEDPNAVVKTANFFAIDVLAGTNANHYLDVAMTNEPKVGFTWSLGMLLTANSALKKADKNPGYRPVTNIASLGGAGPVVAPTWMQIRAAAGMPLVDEKDFRRELDMKHYPHGLRFDILVSDTTNDPDKKGWTKLGDIHLTESIVSYGCDRRLHFGHPKLE